MNSFVAVPLRTDDTHDGKPRKLLYILDLNKKNESNTFFLKYSEEVIETVLRRAGYNPGEVSVVEEARLTLDKYQEYMVQKRNLIQ